MERPLYEIAKDIRENWKNIDPFAKEYVDALAKMKTINEKYGCEDADTIVIRFLCNVQTWRGEHARRIKLELNTMLKNMKK